MTFKEFILTENNKTQKTIKLNTDKALLKIKKELNTFYLYIIKTSDPNIKGKIPYDSYEEAQMAFKNLKTLGSLLNYMNYAKTNYDTAYKLSSFVRDEVSAERKKSPEEIKKDNLNFDIRSPIEKEIDAQLKADLKLAQVDADIEPEPATEAEQILKDSKGEK